MSEFYLLICQSILKTFFFRSRYSTQHALLRLLGHWQQCLDKGGFVGTVLTDLSKAFDTLSHDLLIAKLYAYGFSKNSLRLLKHYLSERYQCSYQNRTSSK